MKAIINEKYGSPDILELREVPRPEPKPKEVLVKVLATSINKADWFMLHGQPFPVRFMAGFFRPKNQILGADIAGVVERVGSEVTQFKPGDEVFGELSSAGFGGLAEYATAPEKLLAQKPFNLNFEEAAALPMASLAALQGLRDKGKVQAGQEVLINGASGGVGSYAVQIAKAYGATVTAVASTRKMDHARKLGADEVIDYTVQDFTKSDKQYDLIFDVAGNHGIRALSKVLKPKGTYVSVPFSMGATFLGPWIKAREGKTMTGFLSTTNKADLQHITKLAEEEKLRPVIEKTFTLDDAADALRAMGKGGLTGKLVVTI